MFEEVKLGENTNSNKPTVSQLKEIIKENNVDLFEAQIIFASKLPDYHAYEGPDKESVVSTITNREEEKIKSKRISERKKELHAEHKTIKEIIEILKQEGLWRE